MKERRRRAKYVRNEVVCVCVQILKAFLFVERDKKKKDVELFSTVSEVWTPQLWAGLGSVWDSDAGL